MSLCLAFLVILYGILLVVGGKSNIIDMTYLHLIDDLERFKSFLWGHVAYSHLVMRTHQFRRILDNIEHHDKRLALDANSFVLALQVWVYEVIPMVSRNCAIRVREVDDRLPRMLRWLASTFIKFDLVNQYFLQAPIDSLMRILTVSEDEKQFLKKLGINATIGCLVGRKNEGIDYHSPEGNKNISPNSAH
ncbi:hypothetical protein C2S52_008605 [Perilla frutescens var. hirtella]|nr:hypothetical protein C2S52_008605 [Perilla frutescens var. hirtella]